MAEISTIARPYAVAAYNLAKEQKDLARWSDMLSLMSGVAQDDAMQAFLTDPKVLKSEQETVFLDVCSKYLNEHGQNLVKVLVEYGRLSLLPAISASYEALKAKDEGVLQAEIISAVALADAESKEIIQKLEARFDKKIEVQNSVDPDLLGGMKIIVGDTVIDTSVQSQLQNLAYTLSE